jgi:hypothetical protein
MRFRIIDELLLDQLIGLMIEIAKLNPEWSRVCRTIAAELESLPLDYDDDDDDDSPVPNWSDRDVEILNIDFLMDEFRHLFGPEREKSFTLRKLLSSTGLKLSDE